MYCPNCGNKTTEDAKFCDRCGHNLTKKGRGELKQEPNENTAMSESAHALWKQFLKIARVEEGGAERYNADSVSSAAWEVLARFGVNVFDDLTTRHKIDFDRQPYKAMDDIKAYLQAFAAYAFQVHIAERVLHKKVLEKATVPEIETLATEWQRVYRNYSHKILAIPDDVATVLAAIHGQFTSSLFDANTTLKDLPNAVIDAIHDTLRQQLISGYLLGVAEDNLRVKI